MPGKCSGLVALFSFLTLTIHAQKNLKEALVVLNNQDTLKGYIDYKEWYRNPSDFLFTAGRGSATRRYGISDVSYFEVTGFERYKRYTVTISMDNEIISNLGDRDTSSRGDVVFLKIVQKGKNVTLFSFRDKLKKRLYLLQDDETVPLELQNSVYMQNEKLQEERQYRSMLLNSASKYLPGDDNIAATINNAGYYYGVIEEIVLKLNGMTAEKITSSGERHVKSRLKVFAGLGVSQGSLKVGGSALYAGKNSEPFYSPVGNVGVDLVINPVVGRLIFRAQIQATGNKTDAYVFKDYQQYTEEYFFKFRQVNITLAPQLLYNLYNQPSFKWHLGAGVGLNLSSYPVNQEKFIRKSSTNAEATNDKYIQGLKSLWMNACFSTGVNFNRLEASFLYFPRASITQPTGAYIDHSSLQLQVLFFLKN